MFSKLWYLAQALPMPASVSQQLTAAAGNFLWRGHLERLAWQELHRPLLEGGLAISCLQSRAQAMWAKQACWALGGDTQAGLHLNACSHLFMPQFSQLAYYSSYTVFYISIVQNACNHFIFTVLAPSKVSYWKRHLVALILFTSFLFNAYSTILPYIGVETALVCSVFPFVPHWPVL